MHLRASNENVLTSVGFLVGDSVGFFVGDSVGFFVGLCVWCHSTYQSTHCREVDAQPELFGRWALTSVGFSVGFPVGDLVGFFVGDCRYQTQQKGVRY